MGVWLNRALRWVPKQHRGWSKVAAESLQGQRGGADRFTLAERVKALRAGFTPESLLIYQLGSNEPSDYVTERARHRYGPRVNGDEGAQLLDDKEEFARRMPAGVTPEVVASIRGGRMKADLGELLDGYGRLILKPTRGRRGQGIRVIDDASWSGALPDEGLLVPFVQQADYANDIFSGATNTVRALMLRDERGPFLAAAVHRFGTEASTPVDNWSHGGLCAGIDVLEGTLGPAVYHPRGMTLDWTDHHPDTRSEITGIRIPGWASVHALVEEVGRQFPFLMHVGWDIAITNHGPVIIEGNNYCDLDLVQVHGGLLRDQRVRRAYQQLGMA